MLGKLAIAALIPGILFAQEAALPLFRIAELPSQEAIRTEDGLAVSLSGRINLRTSDALILEDGTGLIWIYTDLGPIAFQSGDRIRLDCSVWESNGSGEILAARARNATLIAHETPPPPIDVSAADIVAGRHPLRVIRVRGVITYAFRDEADPAWLDFIVETPDAHFIAVLNDRNATDMKVARTLIDREVILTGIVRSPAANSNPHICDEPSIYIPTLDDIRPTDSPSDGLPHRQPFAGTVVSACGPQAFFLALDDGRRLRVKLADDEKPVPPGQRVTVAGFVRKNKFVDWLDNAVVRTADGQTARPIPAVPVTPREIIFGPNGVPAFKLDYQGALISIHGTISDLSLSANAEPITYLDSDGVRIPVHLGGIPPPPVGGKVAVTGGCLIISEADDGPVRFCRFKGFEIFPRDADDIQVLERPPWWTPLRLSVVILGLFLAMIGISIWNRLLKRVIERQSHQLLRTRLAKERSSLRTKERTLLSIELHDSLSQNLTGVGLQLTASKHARAVDPEAADQHVAAALRILKSSRVELDRCIRDLRSNALDNPNFADAIRQTLEPMLGSADLALRFNVGRDQLDERTAHAVLSIIRELVSNAISHGRATQVRVAGEISTGQLKFAVSDNGTGFPAGEIPGVADGHFGLAGIRERVKDMNGTMEISAASRGRGTRIAIALPHPNDEQGEAPADEED